MYSPSQLRLTCAWWFWTERHSPGIQIQARPAFPTSELRPTLSSSLGGSPRWVSSVLSTFSCVKCDSIQLASQPPKDLVQVPMSLSKNILFLVTFLKVCYKYTFKLQWENLGNVLSYKNYDFTCMPTATQDGGGRAVVSASLLFIVNEHV